MIKKYIEKAQKYYADNFELSRNARYAEFLTSEAVSSDVIIFTSNNGKEIGGNPLAFFMFLIKNEQYRNMKFIWTVDKGSDHKDLMKSYKGTGNILLVEKESDEYFAALSKAKYIVNDGDEPAYFCKKPDQIIIKTGTDRPDCPVGFEVPGNAYAIGKTMRNYLMADFIVSPDHEYTDKVLMKAFKLAGIFQGKIVECGFPKAGEPACKQLAEAVFEKDETCTVGTKKEKTRLLFHTDGLVVYGITTSLLNLLNHIDYDKYDVTLNALVPYSNMGVVNLIPEEVRTVCRIGKYVATIDEEARMEYCKDRNITLNDDCQRFPHEAYEREYRRCVGDAEFDYIINFTGYYSFWQNVLMQNKKARHIIWMHNDLKDELDRKFVNGVQVHSRDLPQIFKLYSSAYRVVGCSRSTMEINRDKLATPENRERFTWVHNILDVDKITRLSHQEVLTEYDGIEWLADGDFIRTRDGAEQSIKLIKKVDQSQINFINIGRLSVEKNQAALIKAFANVHRERPETRLYILGDGPLRKELEGLVSELDMDDSIFLLGNVKNPFVIEKNCDCFVLPSLHEGMPMSLLEARCLGLPIIVSDFSTVKDSLIDGGQLLIGTSVEEIQKGLEGYIEGNVPDTYDFNPMEYNKSCVEEFERLFA